MEKYSRECHESVFNRLEGYKQRRSSEHEYGYSASLGSRHRPILSVRCPDQHRGMAYQGNPTHSQYPSRVGYTIMDQNMCSTWDMQNKSGGPSRVNRAIAGQSIHNPQGMQSERGDLVRKYCAAVNRDMQDAEYVLDEENDRVSEAIILVGTILCPMLGLT
jgi:hypothetical protein